MDEARNFCLGPLDVPLENEDDSPFGLVLQSWSGCSEEEESLLILAESNSFAFVLPQENQRVHALATCEPVEERICGLHCSVGVLTETLGSAIRQLFFVLLAVKEERGEKRGNIECLQLNWKYPYPAADVLSF